MNAFTEKAIKSIESQNTIDELNFLEVLLEISMKFRSINDGDRAKIRNSHERRLKWLTDAENTQQLDGGQ